MQKELEEGYRGSERITIKLGKVRRQRRLREQWPLTLGTSFLGLKNLKVFKCVFRCVEPLELSIVRYPKSPIALAMLIINLELQTRL